MCVRVCVCGVDVPESGVDPNIFRRLFAFFFRVDTGTSKYTYMYTIPEESRYILKDGTSPIQCYLTLEMGFFDHHSYE